MPPPSIAWHKSVGSAQGGHQGCGGSCFTIPSVSLATRLEDILCKYFYTHHIKYLFCTSGDYLCSAVNGVGHPQHATITLNVLCRFIIVLSSLSTDVFFCVKCRSYIQDILRKDKRKHV